MAKNKAQQLARIASGSARTATSRNRLKGLMKKARELATLCDVNVGVIVFQEDEEHADVWPSVPAVMEILSLLVLREMPGMDRVKKMIDQVGFMRERIVKVGEQVRQVERENAELETTLLIMQQCLAGGSQLDGASPADLDRLLEIVGDRRLERARTSQGGALALHDGAATQAAAGDLVALAMATTPETSVAPAGGEIGAGESWWNAALEGQLLDAVVAESQMRNLLTKRRAESATNERRWHYFITDSRGGEEPEKWIIESPVNMVERIVVATEGDKAASQDPPAAINMQSPLMPHGAMEVLSRQSWRVREKGEGSNSGGGGSGNGGGNAGP